MNILRHVKKIRYGASRKICTDENRAVTGFVEMLKVNERTFIIPQDLSL
jgi:hypothetical protein